MDITALSLLILLNILVNSGPAQSDVSLSLSPDRSQFFKYESVSLGCEEEDGSSRWAMKRDVSSRGVEFCPSAEGSPSSCTITDTYQSDSGVYWCESGEGERSKAVNITVTEGDVILDSPIFPVTEGDVVTLRCRYKITLSSLTADFYKDGSLIRTESTGQMTIRHVYKSDEGTYRCKNSDLGESPESWLAVKDQVQLLNPVPSPSPAPLLSLPRLICHLVVVTPYFVTTIILISICRDRARARSDEERRHSAVVMEICDNRDEV